MAGDISEVLTPPVLTGLAAVLLLVPPAGIALWRQHRHWRKAERAAGQAQYTRAAIQAARADYPHIFVAYADCGTSGALDHVLHEAGVQRLPGPHCYAFYSGTAAFLAAGDRDMRSFFLTDFLARQFQALVIEPLGLDRHPELRDLYFGQYETLVYLAQTEDAALDQAATRAAQTLGLRYERRQVGYGDLRAARATL